MFNDFVEWCYSLTAPVIAKLGDWILPLWRLLTQDGKTYVIVGLIAAALMVLVFFLQRYSLRRFAEAQEGDVPDSLLFMKFQVLCWLSKLATLLLMLQIGIVVSCSHVEKWTNGMMERAIWEEPYTFYNFYRWEELAKMACALILFRTAVTVLVSLLRLRPQHILAYAVHCVNWFVLGYLVTWLLRLLDGFYAKHPILGVFLVYPVQFILRYIIPIMLISVLLLLVVAIIGKLLGPLLGRFAGNTTPAQPEGEEILEVTNQDGVVLFHGENSLSNALFVIAMFGDVW